MISYSPASFSEFLHNFRAETKKFKLMHHFPYNLLIKELILI